MSNYQQTKLALRSYIIAGVPLVIVQSVERHRVESMVREVARENNFNTFYYTEARQIVSFNSNGTSQSKDVDSDPLPFANESFMKSKHTVFVLGDTGKLDQDTLYTRELLGTVYVARETHNTVVVVAAESVWPRLSRFGLLLKLDFPDFDEREELVKSFAEDKSDRVCWDDKDLLQLTTLTRGLSEVQIVNLLRASLVLRGSLGSKDIFDIASQKELLFSPVNNVVPVANRLNLEVAGLENLKRWLDRKKEVFFAPSERLNERSLQPPKGILLAGVPGCGKSFSAKMIAARWELPLFRFDLGSIYNKYVGESERQMQEALTYIDNVAPCVLWVDEIEKALSSSSGESDVGKRILGQFLFWLQESSARVFLVATANDVSKLPPELFRKGRFAETFFIDLPNIQERIEAIRLYTSESLHVPYSEEELFSVALACEGFSYSDIEQAIKDYGERVLFSRAAVPSAEELANHFTQIVSVSEANDAIEAIRAWGATHAKPASMEDTQ